MSSPNCNNIGVVQGVSSMNNTIQSLSSIYCNNLSPTRTDDSNDSDSDSNNSDDSSQSASRKDVAPDFTPIDATMYKLIVEGKLDDMLKSQVSLEKLKCKEYENSVLHIAAGSDILKLILDNHNELIKLVEDDGQSPLSYAAFKGHIEGVQYLLNKFPKFAYECDKEASFPIHKAACSGNVEVIQKLHMTKNLLNKKGQSILHLAAKYGKSKLVLYLIKMPELARLINLKDEDGNTPLHLATRGLHPRAVYILTRENRCNTKLQNKKGLTALDIFEVHVDSFPTFEARLTWMALRYVDAPRSSQSIRKGCYKQLQRVRKQKNKANSVKELDGFKKRVDTHMLVATLVATVTFAAGFTLPGGYNQSDNDPNIGMAVLPDRWPFKAFILCNTAALYSAVLCVVILIWAHLGDLKLILVSLKFALPLLGFALVMMSLAFMMGIFVVLRTVPWLSYVVLCMGCTFLFGVLLFFIPLYNPSSIKNSVVRFFFSGTFLLLLLVCEKSSITYA
ncbi:protein ACCELERATED CELL DEATH 6-like [Chenopodium quinoa]|uniref:protein ACCELERATED CELL DEATH 6-like n=1 Tax=Chenopodium quinoa TaxID=63459 RepID=UPI000B787219|nr:protein ACCELERATED CELL DEATH 6-like [Chenopodium quinoa]